MMEAEISIDRAKQAGRKMLSAANDDYTRSVQQGDVGCFARILAEDLLCSNRADSLFDKRQFLGE